MASTTMPAMVGTSERARSTIGAGGSDLTAQLRGVLAVLRRHKFSVTAGALTAEAQLRGVDLGPTAGDDGGDSPPVASSSTGSAGNGSSGFQCPVCARVFTFKTNLRRHMRTIHGGAQQRRFECDVCGKRFARSDDLRSHMLVHSSAAVRRPHACPHAGCDKTFARITDLRRYVRSAHPGTSLASSDSGASNDSGASGAGSPPAATSTPPRGVKRATRASQRVAESSHQTDEASAQASAQEEGSQPRASKRPRRVAAGGVVEIPGLGKAAEPHRCGAGDSHRHGRSCGHKAILQRGRVGFLLPDGTVCFGGNGEGSDSRASVQAAALPESDAFPSHCNPTHECNTDKSHVHAPGCGHPMVRHGDHIDFVVDGYLHHPHVHGPSEPPHTPASQRSSRAATRSRAKCARQGGDGADGGASASSANPHCDVHGELKFLEDDVLAFLDGMDLFGGPASGTAAQNA